MSNYCQLGISISEINTLFFKVLEYDFVAWEFLKNNNNNTAKERKHNSRGILDPEMLHP